MKSALGLDLVILAMFLWVVVIFLFGDLTRDVARVAPPKTNRPLRNLFEANDFRRVWREHKKHFPKSRRRTAVTWLLVAVMICVLIGFHFVK